MASKMIQTADSAVDYARSVRKYHARRTRKGSRQRETDIKIALERLATSMRPLRSALARAPYVRTPQDERDRIYEASQRVQRERRKLWKMQNRRQTQ